MPCYFNWCFVLVRFVALESLVTCFESCGFVPLAFWPCFRPFSVLAVDLWVFVLSKKLIKSLVYS